MPSLTNSNIVFPRYSNLAVQFHALITFNLNNAYVSYPADFDVPPVPISWTGVSFSGRLVESGPGEDTTDLVGGTLSADGREIASLTYSRKIIQATNSGIFYSVTLIHLPADFSVSPGIFAYSGGLIKGYVTELRYEQGPIVAGQISASTTYASTDWVNPQQPPKLELTFGG